MRGDMSMGRRMSPHLQGVKERRMMAPHLRISLLSLEAAVLTSVEEVHFSDV
jgi:hypothetical protein